MQRLVEIAASVGVKTLKSKNACYSLSQTLRALILSLASFVVFAVLQSNYSPVNVQCNYEKVSSNSKVVIPYSVSNNSNGLNNINIAVHTDDVSDITIID